MELQTDNSQERLEEEWGTTYPTRYHDWYKTLVVKTVWYWNKDRNIFQWNRIESLEADPFLYEHFISKEGDNEYHWKKKDF